MLHRALCAVFIAGFALRIISAAGQEMQPAGEDAPKPKATQGRAAATRTFLGLGAPPDPVAAARAAPVYQQNCAFCHGAQARGATGPGLITSDMVLTDEHGERLAPFFKVGRPEKGMPAFAQLTDRQRADLAEYLHQQVEDVANRGAYEVQNIVVGDAARGQAYFMANCMRCHAASTFVHIASRFRAPDQLQRNWVWPSRNGKDSLAITATVVTADGVVASGRVTQVSDFSITLQGSNGHSQVFDRKTGVRIQMNDPLAAHQAMIMTLKNQDMHDVTAYLELLK